MRSIPEGLTPSIKQKFVLKSMRIARQIGEDNDICYSRKIGTVITDIEGSIQSTGYNGPARHLPHTDTKEYIGKFLLPRLTPEEKGRLADFCGTLGFKEPPFLSMEKMYDGCKVCPRRALGYKSGERLDICACSHSEQNSIISAGKSLKGCILFNWSPISCLDCTKNVIQAGIKEVHFLDEVYDSGSITLYSFASVPIFLYSKEEIEYNRMDN